MSRIRINAILGTLLAAGLAFIWVFLAILNWAVS